MGAKNKGSLKTSATVGKISSIKAFGGVHPDGGRMRVLVQGAVITDAIKGKQHVEICIKPDFSFDQAVDYSKMLKVLGMDFSSTADREAPKDVHQDNGDDDEENSSNSMGSDEEEDKGKSRGKAVAALSKPSGSDPISPASLALPQGTAGPGGGALVEKWMTTQGRMSGSQADHGGIGYNPRSSVDSKAGRSTRFSIEILPPPPLMEDEGGEQVEGGRKDWKKLLEAIPDEANSMPKKRHHAVKSKDKGNKEAGGGSDGGSSDGSDNDGGSSDGGSQGDGQSSIASSQQDHAEEVSEKPLLHHLHYYDL
jgi:hypothetical protein